MTENSSRQSAGGPTLMCVSSGKGGVGKTSVGVNLGLALADQGHRVLLVDGDLGLANIDVMLGLMVENTVRDVLMKDGDPLDAVVWLEDRIGVLPASSGVPDMVNLGPEDQAVLARLLRRMAENFDFVIMDTAAGIGSSVTWFNSLVAHNIVLLTPDPTSLTDAYALIKVLSRDYDRHTFHLILNQVEDEKEGLQLFDGLAKVVEKFLHLRPLFLGSVPRDPQVVKSVRSQTPLLRAFPESKAAKAIRGIAQAVAVWRQEAPQGAGMES